MDIKVRSKMNIMLTKKLLSFFSVLNTNNLSNKEIFLLEATIYVRIYYELIEFFKKQNENYFRFIKFTKEMEKNMLETNFLRLIINDILSTEEYALQGIAYYTKLPEDIIYEFASGINTKPSATSLLKILELHISIRKDFYKIIINKLLSDNPETT